MTRIALNGLGRIGKLALRDLIDTGAGGEIVLINDPMGTPEQHALLMEFDSVHGRWPRGISFDDASLTLADQKIRLTAAKRIEDMPLAELGVDLVIDCTGVFKTAAKVAPYYGAGVKKVVVSAPVKDGGALNLVYGVNHQTYDPLVHHLVTAASCTTNCLAPVVKVLHEGIGIRHGSITTIHDVTNTQILVDRPAKDMRRARSALMNLIPTSTGSATAITLIYPELTGRLNGHAVRVPLLNASLTDCVFEMARETSVEAVNALFKTASEGALAGILGYETRPLVSTDYINDPRSAIVDAASTMVIAGTQVKVYAWYDNEWGYACRLADIARMVAGNVTAPPSGLRAYAAVTAAYWAFMLSDGALRLLVLLHFNALGFTPIQLAWLFLLYECAGVVTNLSAGWLAARFGLATTLYLGLGIQIAALVALAQLDIAWSVSASVIFVMAVQGASGVAKDLAKMSSKAAVKVLAPKAEGALFAWVAVLTGSKNAVKGFGFFLGAALLGLIGFRASIWGMAVVLAVILLAVTAFLPKGLPPGKKAAKFAHVWSREARINRLSLARMFLFAARDVWFVVGVPVYFQMVLSDGSAAGNRAAFFLIGGFMALWTIAYGAVQAFAPNLLRARGLPDASIIAKAIRWAAILTPIPLVLAALALAVPTPQPWFTLTLVAGLLLFGFVFAVNSSVHSYLILAFAASDRVTMDVGFYYMANAAGRLLGTALSGVSYQMGGLPLCLATAAAMAVASWLAAGRLRAPAGPVRQPYV